MNPTRKARKEIFLNDENKDKERKKIYCKNQSLGESLEENLQLKKWQNLLKIKLNAAENNLKHNLKNTLDSVKRS